VFPLRSRFRPSSERPDPARRRVLRALALSPFALVAPSLLGLVGCSADAGAAAVATSLDPTLACADDDDATPTQAETEGPYFKPSSPERTSLLEAGMQGTPLLVSGAVLTRSCQPVKGALLDFWQADDSGEYDTSGFRLRGHQYADAEGKYFLETIVPGLYPGRTRHIHVKVQAPGQPVLTTQLFFPGEPRNARDGIYRASLLLAVRNEGATRSGKFNFVLDLA
jgi:protocatechuate 3,4-dioxygenase beta subunit